jgi:hypothetical protein
MYSDFQEDYPMYYDIDPSLSSSTDTLISSNDRIERRRKNKTSFIWSFCREIQNGWECIVPKEGGEPCGVKFLYEHTKGSTSNTLYHLQTEHNLVRPTQSKKVICIFYI